MKLLTWLVSSLLCFLPLEAFLHADDIGPNPKTDWPAWRGPTRNGIAHPSQNLPTKWGETENIIWKTPIPGRGHGAPTVVGQRVFIATADEVEEVQSVQCLDRQTGKQLWKTDIHRGQFVKVGLNKRSTHASSTPACDGERVYINFPNAGAIFTTALDLNGNEVWQTRVSDYVLHQGFGSSPMLYQSLVLVAADNKGGGAIAGLDRLTGKIVWKQERSKLPNYASPIVLTAASREQLIMIGCDVVASFDPLSGTKIWEHAGSTTECVTSTVTDGKLIITSGGYPRNHVSAMRADGSGKIEWENNTRVYVPSLLLMGGYLYAVADAGFAICWEASSGKEMWKGRLGGNFSASPILVDGIVYATNEIGETYLFRANPNSFEVVGTNKLGDEVFATAAICGGRMFQRAAVNTDGKRLEYLLCIGSN